MKTNNKILVGNIEPKSALILSATGELRISSNKASNLPKRDVRFILLK